MLTQEEKTEPYSINIRATGREGIGAPVEYEVGCERVEADPLLLKIVLDNLLSNALKFRFKHRELRVHIRALPQGELCRIEVQDNSIGILPGDEGRLYTPFTRLHGAEECAGVVWDRASSRRQSR